MRIFINCIIILIFLAGLLHANTYKSGEVVRLSENDTLVNDLICAGRYIEIQGNLAGDLFSGSEQMTLDGTIEDDIVAAGRTVLIKGSVGDMVIGMGEKVLIDGEVGGDVLPPLRGPFARLHLGMLLHGLDLPRRDATVVEFALLELQQGSLVGGDDRHVNLVHVAGVGGIPVVGVPG